MTTEEAIAKAETRWWESCTADEIVRFQLYEELLCMPFGEYHKAVEQALGRPVWTHEFADGTRLQAEYEGREPTPENPAQHAIDSLAALMLAHGKDPDKQMIIATAEQDKP